MRPYTLAVPDAVLDDLRHRLQNTRWSESLPGVGWHYGADIPYLSDLCDYWQHGFNWRQQEAQLNRLPQFLSRIDGVDLHFIHVRGKARHSLPLLLLHGWPGSMIEFLELIGPLSDPLAHGRPAEFSFDLVIPSLPGFGFGGKPKQPGWGASRVAGALNHLMTKTLGYAEYCVQGGDWGTIIGNCMARHHAAAVRALHINMPYGPPPAGVDPGAEWAARHNDLTGYLHLHNTRPDTLTAGLSDSPAGLAAWIIEKFRSWSDCGGEVERAFSRDTLLTNLMFYWAPNSIASATRIYFESAGEVLALFGPPRVEVPTGVAAFPKEPYLVPRSWLEPLYNITRWTNLPRGGHFAALEAPELLATELYEFFGTHGT